MGVPARAISCVSKMNVTTDLLRERWESVENLPLSTHLLCSLLLAVNYVVSLSL